MANMTKTQIKKKVEELKERLSDLRLEFEELQSDIESESNDIEPYEGSGELLLILEYSQLSHAEFLLCGEL